MSVLWISEVLERELSRDDLNMFVHVFILVEPSRSSFREKQCVHSKSLIASELMPNFSREKPYKCSLQQIPVR